MRHLKHLAMISAVIRFHSGAAGFRGGALRNSTRGELPGD